MQPINARCGLIVLLLLVAGGCTHLPQQDRAPRRPPDVSGVPDAVPRDEPRSRYGNPSSYEVFGKTYRVMDSAKGFKERGVASWYGEKFHGRRTSSGEPYDMYRMTAAHKNLPLPTYVRVTNLKNGRAVTVRVNDRGPFVHNRVIDLSYTAAKRLGIIADGTGLVEIEALSDQTRTEVVALQQTPAPIAPQSPDDIVLTDADTPASTSAVVDDEINLRADGDLFVQLGAFSDPLNAEEFARQLVGRGFAAAQVMAAPREERMVYRVRIGPVPGIAELDVLTADLEAAGISDYHLAYE